MGEGVGPAGMVGDLPSGSRDGFGVNHDGVDHPTTA